MQKPEDLKLEELLKLKKAELPSKVEWNEFDEGLRRKMALCVVGRESVWNRILSKAPAGSLRYASAGAALLVVAAALFVPAYISSVDSAAGGYMRAMASEGESLPNLAASFTGNELLGLSDSENPVAASMSAGVAGPVSYVSGNTASLAGLNTY